MRLLKYSNYIEKKTNVSYDLFLDFVKQNIQNGLGSIEAKSEIQKDRIIFKRIVRNTADSGENKREAWKILREGEIKFVKISSNLIGICWEVKLDTLLFLSILLGSVIGLIIGFASSILIISQILIGLGFSILVYFIGLIIIKSEMDGIIKMSI